MYCLRQLTDHHTGVVQVQHSTSSEYWHVGQLQHEAALQPTSRRPWPLLDDIRRAAPQIPIALEAALTLGMLASLPQRDDVNENVSGAWYLILRLLPIADIDGQPFGVEEGRR